MFKLTLLLTILFIGRTSFGACEKMRRIHGMVDLKKSTWETTQIVAEAKEFCEARPEHPYPNLSVSLSKGKLNYVAKIYRPLASIWHEAKKGSKSKSNKLEVKHLDIDLFVPEWFKGSELTITNLQTNETITKTEL